MSMTDHQHSHKRVFSNNMIGANQKERLYWLQSLRGAAALLVVLCHSYYFLQGTDQDKLAQSLLLPGAMGVDIFFLISGFIMVITTKNDEGTLRSSSQFLLKRFVRVWPTYAIATFAAVILLRPDGFITSAAGQIALLKSLAFLPVSNTPAPYFGVVYGLGWTLNFEMYFYFALAATMLAGRLRWHVLYVWFFLSIILFPALSNSYINLKVRPDVVFDSALLAQLTNPIILMFVAGVAAGQIYNTETKFSSRFIARILVLATTTLTAATIYVGIYDFHGITGWGAPIILNFLTIAIASKGSSYTPPAWTIWLGEISYSLYLTHRLTQVSSTEIAKYLALEDFGKTWYFVALTTIASIIIAYIFYSMIERKLVTGLYQRIGGKRKALVPPTAASSQPSAIDFR